MVRRSRLLMRWLVGLSIIVGGCGVEAETLPEGALVRVGERALTAEDVQEVHGQLGAYAQARFRGPHGQRALLDAVVDVELLSQEAVDAGLADDPRVRWTLVEEMAGRQLTAELERRLPRAAIAAEVDALRDYYDRHLDELREPEQRSLEGVRFDELIDAERALARCRSGEAELSDFGEVVRTPLASRDDAAFPGFHALLFDPALREGDWLLHPVVADQAIVAGRVAELRPATAPAFEDPAVQERLVNAVREQRLPAVREALMRELAQRWPARSG